MDFEYTPTTTIKFGKGIIEDPYFQKLYDDKTIIVADIPGGGKEELAIIAPGVSETEDVVDKKNTAYSVVSKVFLSLALLCFPAVAFTGLIDNLVISNVSFVIAVVCLLTFSTLGMTVKGKVKNHKVVSNTLCIPSALFNSTRTISIKEKELITTINSIAVRNNLEGYCNSLDDKKKVQAPLHSGNKILIQSIIIHSINFSLKTGEWEQTDKIIGACCELEKTSSISLRNTLYQGIVLNYWLIINSPQLSEEYSYSMDEIENINDIKRWEEILGIESS